MNEELLKDEVNEVQEDVATEVEETVEEVVEEIQPETITEPVAPVKPEKHGLATAALVLGIIAFVFSLLFINYILGIIAIILGVVYLVKKGKKKARAIVGVSLAAVSIIASSVLWYSAYRYFTTTDLNTMMEDIKTVTGGQVDLKDTMDATFKEYVGEDFEMEQLEAFVGGPISYEVAKEFVGDATTEEIQEFINTFDYAAIEKDLGVGFTYEDLVEKLGEDFNFQDLKAYMESLQ